MTVRHQTLLQWPIYDRIWSPMSRLSDGQGHLMVEAIPESKCKGLDFYLELGGGPSTERLSCFYLCMSGITHKSALFYLIICSFLSAMYSLFICVTQDGWVDILNLFKVTTFFLKISS